MIFGNDGRLQQFTQLPAYLAQLCDSVDFRLNLICFWTMNTIEKIQKHSLHTLNDISIFYCCITALYCFIWISWATEQTETSMRLGQYKLAFIFVWLILTIEKMLWTLMVIEHILWHAPTHTAMGFVLLWWI